MIAKTLSLLLPVLLPSWRFFKTVAASPRVEVRVTAHGQTSEWYESHPLPEHVSLARMARRMVWNPRRNTQLYMVTLSERLAEKETKHSTDELARLIRASLADDVDTFEFRLIFLQREGEEMVRFLDYQSPPLDVIEPVT